MNTPFPTKLEIAGLTLAILPFLCNFTETSSRTVNGRVVEEHSINYVALALGPLALVLGLSMLPLLRHIEQPDRNKHLGLVLIIVLAGAFNIARGFGVV